MHGANMEIKSNVNYLTYILLLNTK